MSRSAGNSWRAKAGAVAMLLPMLALSACASSSNDEAMTQKLAAAEAAAEKAIAAQHAAEKAASAAISVRPAPEAPPQLVSDLRPEPDHGDDNGDDEPSHDGGNEQAVAADDVIVPGRGA